MLKRLPILSLLMVLATSTASAEDMTRIRQMLPDHSNGQTGILGPFIWSRASDLGEDARFSDQHGRASYDGEYLWSFQYSRLPRPQGPRHLIHARSNYVSRWSDIAYRIQPAHFILNSTGPHNSKIIIGYMQNGWNFEHADNNDLAHLAAADRVCLFFPVRSNHNNTDRLNQQRFFVNTTYAQQSVCIIEFAAGEIISYDWFRNPGNLHPRILFDLAPYFSGENALYPGVTQPILQFDIDGEGGWTLKIKRDGREGRSGPDDWDHIFTHESPGARPYTVNVSKENSSWAMSVFSPGGRPTDTSEILIGLQPYDRATGQNIDWPERRTRIRDMSVQRLDEFRRPRPDRQE